MSYRWHAVLRDTWATRALSVLVCWSLGMPAALALPRTSGDTLRAVSTRGGDAEGLLRTDLGRQPSPGEPAEAPQETAPPTGTQVTAKDQGRGPVVDLLAQRITDVAGAQTGQVHIDAAIAAGATGVLIGHSETRPGSPTPINDPPTVIKRQMRAAVERQGIRT